MKTTAQQRELQGICASASMTALHDLERARASVAAVVCAMNNYLDTIEEPEERDVWRGAIGCWTCTQDQLTATTQKLREGSS
jgi:uncharacterized protein with beta-barrel porin domain